MPICNWLGFIIACTTLCNTLGIIQGWCQWVLWQIYGFHFKVALHDPNVNYPLLVLGLLSYLIGNFNPLVGIRTKFLTSHVTFYVWVVGSIYLKLFSVILFTFSAFAKGLLRRAVKSFAFLYFFLSRCFEFISNQFPVFNSISLTVILWKAMRRPMFEVQIVLAGVRVEKHKEERQRKWKFRVFCVLLDHIFYVTREYINLEFYCKLLLLAHIVY